MEAVVECCVWLDWRIAIIEIYALEICTTWYYSGMHLVIQFMHYVCIVFLTCVQHHVCSMAQGSLAHVQVGTRP